MSGPGLDRRIFFDDVRQSLYGGALNKVQAGWLEGILDEWAWSGDGNARRLAYILATAHHETGGFKWLEEIWGPTAAQKRYENNAALGNTQPGDGYKYRGRGPVMLTGRRNYTDWSGRLNQNFADHPELVAGPDEGPAILIRGSLEGTFTGKALADYIDDVAESDSEELREFKEARRVINGTDRADLIAGYAARFEAALAAAGAAPGASLPGHDERPAVEPGPEPKAEEETVTITIKAPKGVRVVVSGNVELG